MTLDDKDDGTALYCGLVYRPRAGMTLETGWRHEFVRYTGSNSPGALRQYRSKLKADTIYANVKFKF